MLLLLLQLVWLLEQLQFLRLLLQLVWLLLLLRACAQDGDAVRAPAKQAKLVTAAVVAAAAKGVAAAGC